jgi:DNA-binding PadR family transcriptional regulator
VYGELGRLSEAGLLSVSAEGPRGRKEYSITEAGHAELVRWLADTEPNRVQRSETLLRVFFLGNVTTTQATDYLRQEGEATGRRLALLREMARTGDWDADDLAIYGRLVLEYGLRVMAMHTEWTEWAIDQLNARRPAAADR